MALSPPADALEAPRTTPEDAHYGIWPCEPDLDHHLQNPPSRAMLTPSMKTLSKEDEGYESAGNGYGSSRPGRSLLQGGQTEAEQDLTPLTKHWESDESGDHLARDSLDSTRSDASLATKEALKQRSIRIETKTVQAVPGCYSARDPTDWYMCTLKLLRQNNISKNLFELYCLASRKDQKFSTAATKHPRHYKREVFCPDNMLRVDGQHCDSTDPFGGSHSGDVNDRIMKFARTNRKTPGEIAILLGKEQNRSRFLASCSSSAYSDTGRTDASNLKTMWRNARCPDYSGAMASQDAPWRSVILSPRPPPPPSLAESPTPAYPMNRDTDSPLRVSSVDKPADTKRVTISVKLKVKKDKSSSSEQSELKTTQTILPRLKLTRTTNMVAPNGHPRTKPSRRLGPLPGQAQRGASRSRPTPVNWQTFESSSSVDPINSVVLANQPLDSSTVAPPSSPEWPSDQSDRVLHSPDPEPKVQGASRLPRSRSHVVKLPDINDGRSNSTVDTESLIDRLSVSSPAMSAPEDTD